MKVNTVLPYGSWKTSTQSDEVTLKLLMKYFLQLYNVLGQHFGISKRCSCFTGLLPLYCLWLCLCSSCRSCVGQSIDRNPNPLAGPQWQPHPPHSRQCSTWVIKITCAIEIIFYYMAIERKHLLKLGVWRRAVFVIGWALWSGVKAVLYCICASYQTSFFFSSPDMGPQ